MKRFPLLSLALFAFGCQVDTAHETNLQRVQRTVSRCETQLSARDYRGALETAAQIVEHQPALLDLKDVAADQLRFCYVTAHTLHHVDVLSGEIDRLVSAFDQLLTGQTDAPAQSPGEYQPAAQPFDVFLEGLLAPSVALLENNREHLDAILQRGQFQWTVDRLPVTIAEEELFDARGTYDLGEVQVLQSMTHLLLSGLYLFQANNYTVELGPVISYALLPESPLKHYQEKPAAAILNTLAVLLATHPKFLALKDDTGKQLVTQAGEELAKSARGLLGAVDYMMTGREGDQSGNIFEYRKEGVEDYLVVHIDFEREIAGLELERFDDLSIPLRGDVVQGLKNLEASLTAGGGTRADVQKDIFPLLALTGVVLLKSGALDDLIAETLNEIDPRIAEHIHTIYTLTREQESYLLAELLTAVPAHMELDLGRAFHDPKSLRELLPAWRQPVTAPSASSASMEAFTATTFVYAYECADPLAQPGNKVFCPDPADSEHFAEALYNDSIYRNLGTDWPGTIAADGIASPFVYIGFKDPSFNLTLYIDVSGIGEPLLDDEGTMKLANQRTLNAALASTSKILWEKYGD